MSKFSRNVAFWAFNIVSQYQDRNYQLINTEVLKNAHRIEQEAIQAIASWEAEAARTTKDESQPLSLLTQRSNAFIDGQVEKYWQFAFDLMAKYHHYGTTYNESSVGMEVTMYPDWWLHSPEVGYTSWDRTGPFHGVVLTGLPESVALATRAALTQSFHGRDLVWCIVVMLGTAIAHQVGLKRGKVSADANMDYYYAAQA